MFSLVSDLEAANKRITELEEELAETRRQLELLTRHVFGRKSERTPPPPVPGQMEIDLGQEEDAAIEAVPPAKPPRRKGGSRKGRKTRAALLPADLPVEEHVIIPPAVQAAPEKWREIGREVSERLERIPAKLVRLRLVRPVFVSRNEPFAAPVCAPVPAQLIPGGYLGNQLVAEIVLGKYLHHQPLYRQARILDWEAKVKLPLSTLCETIAAVADAVEPVVRTMALRMWQGGYVQMDLTPVRCLSGEMPGGSFLGQMWVAAAPGGDVIYTWDRSKEALVAERIVPEWFAGILQCDGGSEIACFLAGGKGRTRKPPPIRRAGCWAHVRRKFFEAARSGCGLAARLLKIINVLYRIEGIARENSFCDEQRQLLRQRRSARVVRGLRRRIEKILQQVRPKSPVGKACLYALGQWESLLVYLEHGRVEIDDNSVENAIRPCALGKKNYLFIGAVGAGQRSATLYSLLGSCLRRGINPRAYLRWLFERLPHATNLTVHELTPEAYAALQAAVQSAAA
jgi:transposase